MNRKNLLSKLTVLVVAGTMLVCGAIGTTMAWLVDATDKVTNTFTYGDINITLDETDTNIDGDNNPNTNQYEMVPGKDIVKDPVVTVVEDNEACWLFVKLDKSENFDTFMEYEIAEGWTELLNADPDQTVSVYYREVGKDTDGIAVSFHVLKDDKVSVKGEVTKEQLNALDAEGATNYPTLAITAYAVQLDYDIDKIKTAESAWELIANDSEEETSSVSNN